jgi:hypothetical protein
MKYFVWGAIIFVAAAIVGAFFFIGSPAQQRLRRFDEFRISDLQNIQYQIASYHASKNRLPAALADLEGFQSFRVPVDPETGAEYEYSVQAPDKFRLCANFALASDSGDSPYASVPRPGWNEAKEIWEHPAGRGCFDLLLEKNSGDPAYPPFITVKPAV